MIASPLLGRHAQLLDAEELLCSQCQGARINSVYLCRSDLLDFREFGFKIWRTLD